MMGNPR